jgi:hypothetical protein
MPSAQLQVAVAEAAQCVTRLLQASGGIEVKGKGHMETYYYNPAAALSTAAQQQLQALLRKTRGEPGLQHCWSSNSSPTAVAGLHAAQPACILQLLEALSSPRAAISSSSSIAGEGVSSLLSPVHADCRTGTAAG